MSRRFEMWCGKMTWEDLEHMVDIINGKKDRKRPHIDSVWPIVDNETCGPINGSPQPEQYFCVCWTPEAQRMVCDALNAAHETTGGDRGQK